MTIDENRLNEFVGRFAGDLGAVSKLNNQEPAA